MIYIAPDGKVKSYKFPDFINDYLSIPLNYLNKIDKVNIDRKINYLEIYTKDFRYMQFIFEDSDECNNTYLRFVLLAFPENEMTDIFAFSFFSPIRDLEIEY